MILPTFKFTLLDLWAAGTPQENHVRTSEAYYRLQMRATCTTCYMMYTQSDLRQLGYEITTHMCSTARRVDIE